jgi:xanthine dehydrogenase YagS FAD-binding subunit
MQLFDYKNADSPVTASQLASKSTTAQQGASVRLLAGGTTLLDLMKLDVETPKQVVDIRRLALDKIEATAEGGLKIGATARNSALAQHKLVKERYPVLSQALLSGASAQLRNMATTAGNLLQRTRCIYFRDVDFPCNKREPGSGCPAMDGHNRTLAILGGSDQCIATNPSDMNVALAALEATIHVSGTRGERAIPIAEFYTLPGKTPERETVLEPGDVITHVTLPPPPAGAVSHYLKLRDRASYEFALSSAAVILVVKDRRITHARVALGGVGTIPWRSREAEKVLEQQPVSAELFKQAADAALRDAKPQSENGFKVELAKRCLIHVLHTLTAVQ